MLRMIGLNCKKFEILRKDVSDEKNFCMSGG